MQEENRRKLLACAFFQMYRNAILKRDSQWLLFTEGTDRLWRSKMCGKEKRYVQDIATQELKLQRLQSFARSERLRMGAIFLARVFNSRWKDIAQKGAFTALRHHATGVRNGRVFPTDNGGLQMPPRSAPGSTPNFSPQAEPYATLPQTYIHKHPHMRTFPDTHTLPHTHTPHNIHTSPHSQLYPHTHTLPHAHTPLQGIRLPHMHTLPQNIIRPHNDTLPSHCRLPHTQTVPNVHTRPHTHTVPYIPTPPADHTFRQNRAPLRVSPISSPIAMNDGKQSRAPPLSTSPLHNLSSLFRTQISPNQTPSISHTITCSNALTQSHTLTQAFTPTNSDTPTHSSTPTPSHTAMPSHTPSRPLNQTRSLRPVVPMRSLPPTAFPPPSLLHKRVGSSQWPGGEGAAAGDQNETGSRAAYRPLDSRFVPILSSSLF